MRDARVAVEDLMKYLRKTANDFSQDSQSLF
jgi:hypothetical protein